MSLVLKHQQPTIDKLVITYLNEATKRAPKRRVAKKSSAKTAYKEAPFTHKMWIFPDGTLQPLNQWHWQWLQSHPEVFKRFKAKGNLSKMNEVEGRIKALQVGFFRINYEIRDGSITIEGCRKWFTSRVKDAIFILMMDHAAKVSHITVNLFDDNVKRMEKTATTSIFRYSPQEKLDHIPFVSESSQGKALRLIAEGGNRPHVVFGRACHE